MNLLKYILLLFLFALFHPTFTQELDRAEPKKEQEEVSPVIEIDAATNEAPVMNEVQFGAPPPTGRPRTEKEQAERKKKDKKSKNKKAKKTGPFLVAEHKKRKITREFELGEFVKYKTKTGKNIEKGILEEIQSQYVTIDGKKVEVSSLVIVGKKYGKTMGWRAAGFSNFALGTGLTAAGAALILFSADYLDANSTNVLWATLGIVAGTGTGLVGMHLMIKGSRGVFQSSKLKLEKGWSFSVQP